jgi:hypothetical protein
MATLRTLIDGLRKLQLSSLDVFASWWIERSQQDHIREAVDHDEVSLMTVHGSKGLEAPVVVMLDCYDGQYPSGRVNQSDEERRENLRIFYVGVTRARDRLLLVQPTHITQPWGGPVECVPPSPYLARAGAPPPSTWQPETWGGTWLVSGGRRNPNFAACSRPSIPVRSMCAAKAARSLPLRRGLITLSTNSATVDDALGNG